MPVDLIESSAFGFAYQVERFYAGLVSAAEASPASEPSLGGKLLYAGELDAEARALLVAASIAGAASLALTSDAEAGKQAVRDGVVDFLVTTLDEALRILKNEIRKRQPVAVCVAVALEAAQCEMLERGVAPDLARLNFSAAPEYDAFRHQGVKRVEPADLDENQVLVTWSVAAAPALWLPKLDAIALGCLSELDWAARRWLRLAPRYLGRMAQGLRLLRCNEQIAANFRKQVQEHVERGEIPVFVEMKLWVRGEGEQCRFAPPIG